ncbi:hypothetical protein HPB52_017704 [Rhipicephalus sanguineus]|uniref:Uncharacterized protein n=1 Tax=Rhipicephalus sanguineus TaxID=34632 RepID=A0A9D4T686_RHISA|nr:hypothetical protein HPB52_017704 [Rhipicephalus sanguineus]
MDGEVIAEQKEQQWQPEPSTVDADLRATTGDATAAASADASQATDDDSQMMADWASEQAVEAVLQEIKGHKDWEVLRAIIDGEDEALQQDEADWETEEAKKQRSLHANACCKGHPPSAGNMRPCQMSAYQRLDNGITPIILACVLSFVIHPVLMLLHRMALRVFPSTLRLLVGLEVPALLVIKTFMFALPVGVASLFVDEMRDAEDGVATTIAFLIRLLINATIVRMGARIIFVVMLYTYEKYSKYLVCQRPTLAGLYEPAQCVLPSWCKLAQESSDPEDTFRRASCLYQRLAMSEEGAMLQVR